MKKIITNYRYYVLAAIAIVVLAGIVSVPDEGLTTPSWYAAMLLPRFVAAVVGYAGYKLLCYWDWHNRIPELSKLIAED